jgi:hypothetical protein
MKRSELSPGLEVERKQGREYPSFTTGIIVLDDHNWDSVPRWRRRSPDHVYEPAQGPKDYAAHRGIPCAVRVGTEWRPKLIRAQELVPAGSAATHDAAQQQAKERQNNLEQQRNERLQSLKERSGVEMLRYATGWQNIDYTSVTLSIEDFERVLSDALEARTARAAGKIS